MKRLGRYIVNAATALSLALFSSALSLGVRSYRTADAWGWSRPTGAVQLGTAYGRLRLGELRLLDESRYAPPSFAHVSYAAAADPPTERMPARWSNLGFGYERKRVAGNYDSRTLLVPMWLVVAAAGVLPARWARMRWRRGSEGDPGRVPCPGCGYDIRATPERCPECGAVPSGPP